ncbi:MAG: hypothetical protein R3D63_16445 [Paracoccaceae bacterium]
MSLTPDCAPVPLPQGLAAFLLSETPAMWHEFALGLDFADPHATIDLLLAAHAITRSADCDRATAALILAKATAAGFHRAEAPAAFDAGAARAFALGLAGDIAAGRFARARFALPPEALRLIIRQLGPRGALRLPPLSLGHVPHRARFAFAGWHPVRRPAQARSA